MRKFLAGTVRSLCVIFCAPDSPISHIGNSKEKKMDWGTLLNNTRRRNSRNPGGENEIRLEFERDYDRTIFSTPVRRLQDKAQVFPLDPNDAVRTRLTHSIEVSAVARGLARGISIWLVKTNQIGADQARAIEAIAATCGLIHDLGNPPFGHAGEDAIRNWFTTRFKGSELPELLENNSELTSDFTSFEGNAQTLRIVSKLQVMADMNGLNLTYGTLSAACKYLAAATNVDANDHRRSKPGYFASEKALIEEIRQKTGTGDARNPITFLVEAADDAVYAACDIEDAVKKEIVSRTYIKSALEETDDRLAKEALEKTRSIIGGIDVHDEIWASAFRTAAIAVIVYEARQVFERNYQDIMSGTYAKELVKDSAAWPLLECLKEIARDKVYRRPETLKLEIMGRKVICDLMDLFWEAAKDLSPGNEDSTRDFPGKLRLLLSRNYRKVFDESVTDQPELPIGYHRLQLVTDYVCGMTDSFARRLHAELTNG